LVPTPNSTNSLPLVLSQGRPSRSRPRGHLCSAAPQSLPPAKKGGGERVKSPMSPATPLFPAPPRSTAGPSQGVKPCTQVKQFLDAWERGRVPLKDARGITVLLKWCLPDRRSLKPEGSARCWSPSLHIALCASITSVPGCWSSHRPLPLAHGPVPLFATELRSPSAGQSSLPRGLRVPSSPERAGASGLTWRRR
jgi:hypothetical protein